MTELNRCFQLPAPALSPSTIQRPRNLKQQRADWEAEKVNVGGMPPYDGYVRKQWLMNREEYYKFHGLDQSRKLLTYASSFVNLSPNIQNIQALVNLVNSDQLIAPSQLLIRLHPIHMSGFYVKEADQIRQIFPRHLDTKKNRICPGQIRHIRKDSCTHTKERRKYIFDYSVWFKITKRNDR